MKFTDNKIYGLYRELLIKYGASKNYWPQWGAAKKSSRDREIIAIGAFLTQRTSWHNADLALKNLKRANLLSLGKIAGLEANKLIKLTELIKVAGFYKVKPKRIFDFASFIVKNYDGIEGFRKEKLEIAREKLLSLSGIGPETADTLLLYALDKPSFVIDEYTRRFVVKYDLSTDLDYDSLKNLFEKNLPRSAKIYQNYHTFIIVDIKGPEKSRMRVT